MIGARNSEARKRIQEKQGIIPESTFPCIQTVQEDIKVLLEVREALMDGPFGPLNVAMLPEKQFNDLLARVNLRVSQTNHYGTKRD